MNILDNIKISGRYFIKEENICLSSSGSYIEFVYTGKELSIEVMSKAYSEYEKAKICILVDNEIIEETILNNGINTFSIIKNDERKKHIVKITKLTESQYGSFEIKTISGDGYMEATGNHNTKIIFVGDSITCGAGNLGTMYDEFSTIYSSSEASYATLVSQALKAEYELVSSSGIGVYSSYVDESVDEINNSVLMKDFLPYIDIYWDENKSFAHNEISPKLVVVNLGTNDSSYTRGMEEREKHFYLSYMELLDDIHNLYKEAAILCIYGSMDKSLCKMIKKAVEDYKFKYNQIYYRELEGLEADELGVACHPNIKGQKAIAYQVMKGIKEYNLINN